MPKKGDAVQTVGTSCRLHAVFYDDPETALAAVHAFHAEGFRVEDVHTPYPVHGMAEAIGLSPTRIPYATLAGAVTGVAIAIGFQVWSHAFDWPLLIGGKDFFALPALAPVTFELGVLIASFATVGSLALLARFRPLASGRKQPCLSVTDDRFVLIVDECDASFAPKRFRDLVQESGSVRLIEAWKVY